MFFIPGIIVMALSVKDHLKSVDVFSHLVASIINAGLGYVVAIAAKAVWLAYLNLWETRDEQKGSSSKEK